MSARVAFPLATSALAVLAAAGLAPRAAAQSGPRFPAPELFVDKTSRALAVGDLNGDAFPDLVSAGLDGTISVQIADGLGGYLPTPPTTGLGGPTSLQLADLDNDGVLDALLSHDGLAGVSFLLGNGAGGFAAPTAVAGFFGAVDVASGDLDGNGTLDVVTADRAADAASVALNTGGAAFGPVQAYPSADRPTAIALGDLNGDAQLDAVVSNRFAGNVTALLGNGSGGFGAPTAFPYSGSPEDVVLADFNGDGALDLAVTLLSSPTVQIRLGDGAGGFGASAGFAAPAFSVPDLVAADFTADGAVDLVRIGTSAAALLAGDGAGAFSPPVLFGFGVNPGALAAGDLNLDSIPDLVLAAGGQPRIWPVLSLGGGRFDDPARFVNPGSETSLSLGDLDGDSDLDAVLGQQDGKLAVMKGDGAGGFGAAATFGPGGELGAILTTALGDLNGDGALDAAVAVGGSAWNFVGLRAYGGDGAGGFGNPSQVASYQGAATVAVGDLNNDGSLDVVSGGALSVGGGGTSEFALVVLNLPVPTQSNVITGGISGQTHRETKLADLNGDGALDLVVARTPALPGGAPGGSVLLGDGAGGFFAPSMIPVGAARGGVAVADFNGDATLDLAFGSSTLEIALGTGGGAFAAPLPAGTPLNPIQPYDISAGELTGDGLVDLAAFDVQSGSVRILPGTGTGAFAREATHRATTAFSTKSSLELADLNGDARLDIAATDFTTLSVLLRK